MNQNQLVVKIQTPLMLGDTDQTNSVAPYQIGNKTVTQEKIINAHLGVKPFKAMLRWWFRALHGWSSELGDAEKELFGSTDKAAPVKIKIEHDLEPVKWNRSFRGKSYGEYTFSRGTGRYDGLRYFGYTNFFQPTKEGIVTIREYFEPEESFTIKLLGPPKLVSRYLFLFWFAIHFGGFGSRSRRCFGNLQIENARKFNVKGSSFFFKNSFMSLDDYKKSIANNMGLVKVFFPNAYNGSNEISYFKNAKLFLSEPIEKDGWSEAINFAGVTMQKFRALAPPEYEVLRRPPYTNIELVRPIFGLPIQFRFSNPINEVMLNNVAPDGTESRLASPIMVSLVKIRGRFHVQYLILSRKYSSLNIQAGKTPVQLAPNAISKFEKHLDSFEFEETGEFHYEKIF